MYSLNLCIARFILPIELMVDVEFQAHPGLSKQDRKAVCSLIDSRKLSPEASFHAAQNERLPVRAVIQVLFSEQTKLTRQLDWSGSFSGTRSPKLGLEQYPSRCHSKREVSAQQAEIRRLREEVRRLQGLCTAMQGQMERLLEKKRGSSLFRWKKLVLPSLKTTTAVDVGSLAGKIREGEGREEEAGFGQQTPLDFKDIRASLGRGRPPKWRNSMS